MFENHRKSIIQICERSELRLQFELVKRSKNGRFWRVFENLRLSVKQCYQTIILKVQKLVENAKNAENSNATF